MKGTQGPSEGSSDVDQPPGACTLPRAIGEPGNWRELQTGNLSFPTTPVDADQRRPEFLKEPALAYPAAE